MATEVAVTTAATGAQTFYSNYAAARTAATAGDKIQIWADLTNELYVFQVTCLYLYCSFLKITFPNPDFKIALYRSDLFIRTAVTYRLLL